MERLNVNELHNKRMKNYWSSVIPYFRYLGNSLPIIILILGFCLFGYGYFVNHLPDRFPILLLMSLLFTLSISSGQFRTHLQAADVVFLLPMESHMHAYFKRCWRTALMLQLLIMTLLW